MQYHAIELVECLLLMFPPLTQVLHKEIWDLITSYTANHMQCLGEYEHYCSPGQNFLVPFVFLGVTMLANFTWRLRTDKFT